MTRIWNPYVFTPLGNPIVGEAPPVLRVMGGMQATAQQLSYAQQRFTQFVMQARLSVVPNPTEAGRLPDGTQYRIVKVGPQTTMEIWPGGSSPAGDGAGVGVSVLLGGQRYLFLLTFVNNTWKVTRPKEFFGGDGLWVPANKQPYYLTFNAQQNHEGFFPSKDSEFQTPPAPAPPNASKCRAVAYTNGGALSGAAVTGTRYVGVGRPSVLGNTASLMLYRTNAVSASAIKGTPFEAAADASESVSLGVVVGVTPENMALHPNSSSRASLTGNGTKAEFALVDRQYTLGGLLTHAGLGLLQNPVTKVVTASLPNGPATVEGVAFDPRKKCRQIFSIKQLGGLYTNTANEPALLKGGDKEPVAFFEYPLIPAAPDVSYDGGAVYLAQMYRTTTAFELSDEVEATAFRWIGTDGAQKTARLNTDHKTVIKTIIDQYSDGSSGGCISASTPTGPGAVVSPTTIGFELLQAYPVELPSNEPSYAPLPPFPVMEPQAARYSAWGGTTLGRAIKNIPLGFYTGTTKVREDRLKDTVSTRSSELVLREHESEVELSIRDTVVAFDSSSGVTMERSSKCRYSAKILNREVIYMIPELDIIACMEARTEALYDGDSSSDTSHAFNYGVSRSFVVFHGSMEIFRTEPVTTTLPGSVRLFGGAFDVGGLGSDSLYKLGDIAVSWDPATSSGTLIRHKTSGVHDDGVWPNVYHFKYLGTASVTTTANGGILKEASSDREISMPSDIGTPAFLASPASATHSLAHAFDPNSGGGVVFVFAGTHPNLQNKQPLAGWAFSHTGQVTPISDLLAQYEGHPLTPSAKIEAVISV